MEDNYISREGGKSKFSYFYVKKSNKKKIIDKKILDKISKIYIAPAYKDVKIYLDRDILATGIDDAGRKQYVYSENSKIKRENKKILKMTKLSNNIDKLKNQIKKDLLNKSIDKNKLIALILKIMDLCNFRGGNKKYEEKYGSYGLTTLHKKHVKIKDNSIEIDFIGKKGVQNNCILKDKVVQDIIKKVYNISSKDNPYLFSIADKDNIGKNINVSITDLNNYLEKFDVTTKDLRTWNANIIFLKNFKKEVENMINDISYNYKSDEQKSKIRKSMIKDAIKKTAISLHHTPTICKSSYICKNILKDIEDNESIFRNISNKNIIFEDFLKTLLKKYNRKI
jgi:DNA topoisomerase-1